MAETSFRHQMDAPAPTTTSANNSHSQPRGLASGAALRSMRKSSNYGLV